VLRIKSALTIGLILGLTSLTASAGELSYESRGYGGPLYIGPNFQQGGQHSPPTYGSGSSSSGYHARSREEREERAPRHVAKKKSTSHETVTEKTAPAEKSVPAEAKPAVTKAAEKTDTDKAAPKTADTENSSITTAARTDTAEFTGATESKPATDSEAAPSTPTGCKRFVAAVGAIITVPCD
jgi:hypothetical protein